MALARKPKGLGIFAELSERRWVWLTARVFGANPGGCGRLGRQKI
jgi:hypothetical protein